MGEVVRPSGTVGEYGGWPPADLTHLATVGRKGRVRIGSLLLLFLLAVLVYAGIQAVSAYVNYWSLRNDVRLVVRDTAMAPRRLDEGMERIMARVRELELPVLEHEVVLKVVPGEVVARIRWQQPIGLWGYTFLLPFEIEESQALHRAAR
ncbi:MAG: hypothetical protein ACE5IQ_02155 [Candidatus Methylomirabilales bacterium]